MPRWTPKKARASTPTTNVPVAPVEAPVDPLLVARARIIACRVRGERVPDEIRVYDHLRECGRLAVAQVKARMLAEHASLDQAEEYALKLLQGR